MEQHESGKKYKVESAWPGSELKWRISSMHTIRCPSYKNSDLGTHSSPVDNNKAPELWNQAVRYADRLKIKIIKQALFKFRQSEDKDH